MRPWLLRFDNDRLEQKYERQLNAVQARLDTVVGVLGAVVCTVVAHHAKEAGLPHLVLPALAGISCMALPLVLMLCSRQRYLAHRPFLLLLWLPAAWLFACQGGAVYHPAGVAVPWEHAKVPLPPPAPRPTRWWRQAQPGGLAGGSVGGGGRDLRTLPMRLLVRTELVPLIMTNLGVRQVFRRHVVLHAVCLAVVARFNRWRCETLSAELPFLKGPAYQLAAAARRLSRAVLPVHLPGLAAAALRQLAGNSSLSLSLSLLPAMPFSSVADGAALSLGDGGSRSAQGPATRAPSTAAPLPSASRHTLTCHAVLLFCQLLLSYVAPCCLLRQHELASRRRFLRAAAATCPAARAEQLPSSSWVHLTWQVLLAAAACWQVAEVVAGLPLTSH